MPAGIRPTVRDAEGALAHLREHGAVERVFTLRTGFPPPGAGR
ncbi:DUF3291 domain-containing protein [Streptomyces sp. NBC_00876]